MSFTPEIESSAEEVILTSATLPMDNAGILPFKIPPHPTHLTASDFYLHLQCQVKKRSADAAKKRGKRAVPPGETQPSGSGTAPGPTPPPPATPKPPAPAPVAEDQDDDDDTDPTDISPLDKVALISGIHQTMFKIQEVTINGEQISPHQESQAHVSHLRMLTEFSDQAKKTILSRTGYLLDTTDAFQDMGNLNKGFAARNKMIALGRQLDLYGPVLVDICRQPRPIVPNTTIEVRLFRHSDSFIFLADADDNENPYKLVITKADLIVRRIKPSQATLEYLHRHVTVYQYDSYETRTIMFPRGIASNNIEIWDSPRPVSKVIIIQLSQQSFNGSYRGNALELQHNHLSRCALQVDHSTILPSTPYEIHVEKSKGIVDYSRLYVETLRNIGESVESCNTDINYLMFIGGNFFLVFSSTDLGLRAAV